MRRPNFRIENLSNSLTGLREFGIRVWFVIQELEEYARVYGREALETLLSQTEVKQIFGASGSSEHPSYRTCQYLGIHGTVDVVGEDCPIIALRAAP